RLSSSSSSSSRYGLSSSNKDTRGADDGGSRTKREIPYLFLGSIAAATLVAHKYWPKGFPHGEKEDWELSPLALRAKQRRLAEKAGSRLGVLGSGASGGRES